MCVVEWAYRAIKKIKLNINPINQIFDIETELEYLTIEQDNLYAALMALRDFCHIDEVAPENVTPYNNMTLNPKQFYGLFNIVFDYAVCIGNATESLYHAVETYRTSEHASKNA